MAPVKRKAGADDRPSKKVKAAEVKDDSKEKRGSAREKKPKKMQEGETREKKVPVKSILQQEERAFPRGGGSVLTPIEQKQIKAQAERDVLFEQETGQRADVEDDEGELFDEPEEGVPAKKKRKTERKSGGAREPKVEGSGVNIHSLSYKSVVVGSTVLGRVTAITGRDVALALSNNLTGFAPITAVSERLNARIEKLLADDAKAGAEESDDEDIDLKRLFYPGQWLRATVTATGTDPGEARGKSKKHIELSLDPAQVNGALPEENVPVNSTVQAAVRSVEDHGLVMDLGLADEAVRGFISKKELGSAYKLSKVQEGQVMLCLVTGKGSNGQVLKLSPDFNKLNAALPGPKPPVVSDAPSVDAFLPGTAVEILVTESGPRGVVGKIMGMLDVTAEAAHANAVAVKDMTKKFKLGSKTKARIIYAIPRDDGSRAVGISFQDHILALTPPPVKLPENATSKLRSQATEMDCSLTLSSVINEAKVVQVLPDRGLFLSISKQSGKEERSLAAFAHISQISDKHIDSLSAASGAYIPESVHRVRIISYNPIDNMYYVSLKQSVLDQAFLRLEDLPVGELVKGTVEKLILGGAKGITGVLVKLSDNITALVPEMHLSDAQLQHPERKFKEGFPVRARILSVDLEKRHVRLTLKKSLVDEQEHFVWKAYKDLKPGMESKGTIVNLLSNGAAVQFYGAVRAWLPVAEMSETFIERPDKHFRLGQTVTVRILSVDPESQEMKVTCKDSSDFSAEQQEAWDEVSGGELLSGTVTEKAADSVSIDLENGLKGVLRIGHLVDGSAAKADSALKRIRVGQALSNLVVLDKQERSRTVLLTNKPGMVEDAKAGKLITSFSDAQPGIRVHGFVRNVTSESVYVEFANGIVGLAPKSLILSDMTGQPAFGLRKDQTLHIWVSDTDGVRQRFLLTMKEQAVNNQPKAKSSTGAGIKNAVDSTITSMDDFTLGRITKARIASVKATQINVRLADNVQGRVDISEVFGSWEEISNKAAPLQKFRPNEVIEVKVLGIHDARSHRFLPISHRQGKVPVFELSAKISRVEKDDSSLLSLDSVKLGASHLAFINNHGDNCVWVNLSPNVRGRVALMDLSDDVGQLQNVENRFRIGCALRVTVKAVDIATNRLDLTARETDTGALTLSDLTAGMVLPARVIRSTERLVSVAISDDIISHVPLVELSDDYEQANPGQYTKNDIVRICVVGVDLPNKRVFISLRPSKVLSSSLPVKDPHITDTSSLRPGQIVRGFVKQVAEKGVFVSLGARVDALVRISDLSDQFIKEWRGIYEVDQLVKGRIVTVDTSNKQVQLSLKKSHVDGNYEPPLGIDDLEEGMTVTGKVRKVEDFGAFIDIDNTQPRLSGLCHRSEVAAKRVEDVRKLYSTGDAVKAKILSVDVDNRKISLGLKASYFSNDAADELEDEESDDEDLDMDGGIEFDEDDSDADGGVEIDLGDVPGAESDDEDISEGGMDIDDYTTSEPTGGLKTGGFDWSGNALDADANAAAYESEPELTTTKKRKRNKPEIKEDLTGDLDNDGKRDVSYYERHLLGRPNDAGLWIQYMAFQLDLSEVQKAREIAERALRSIHIRETEEKLRIWLAWLALENEYGDDERVGDVFKQACQVQDPLEMHEQLASIYIDSGKHEMADAVFQRIIGHKAFRASPSVWLNYATFLMNNLQAPARARPLLSKALQSVPKTEHRLLTAKFAALEFRTRNGTIERGRTLFEKMMSTWPKWSSGWDMWVDLERSRIAHVESEDAKKDAVAKTRDLYERISQQKMKRRRAKFVFKRWLEFEEEKGGGGKQAERVKALAQEYVEKMQGADGDGDEE